MTHRELMELIKLAILNNAGDNFNMDVRVIMNILDDVNTGLGFDEIISKYNLVWD